MSKGNDSEDDTRGGDGAAPLLTVYETYQQDYRSFCARFHATLPREIRDLVYDQVIRRGSQQFVLEPRCKKDEAETSDNSHVVGASYFDPQSHMPADLGSRQQVWKYAGYTGKQVAEEIAEHWYRNSLFILDVENELLAKFLTTDVWEQDIVPAECIRHLRLNLKPKDTTEVDTEKTLNLLKTLHKNTKFTFNLNWRDSNFPYRFPPLSQFVKKLDESSLRQLVVSLRAAGFKKITVRQGHCRISACYGYYHCHAHPECLFDITHLFDQDATTFGKVFNISDTWDADQDRLLREILCQAK